MLPSSTVENYLKAIYSGVMGLTPPQRLLPMGQLASALGVAPGTATTMVKALAESGLLEYQPYAGVALTPAGAKLAALVLRRHRLVELFLVQVMGYSWDEVHDEAEQLEHVVSDRLIDRMDEMLGRPEADPHGDPIPNSEGLVKPQDAQSLLTCPLQTRVTVTRVIDQDKVFLRFLEQHNLKPGETIEVEGRDDASDSVRVRGKNDQQITIGMRAASKLLVQVARALLLTFGLATAAFAQAAPAPANSDRPFEITDNSFLVEEAFNQEPGIFQNAFTLRAGEGGDWAAGFTQEWPLFSQTHQISFTIPYASASGLSGVGDVAVHYRIQALHERAGSPAFSPRLSVIIPSGSASKGLGSGSPGWEMNFPFSRQVGDLYVHWNAGFTHFPSAEIDGVAHDLLTPRLAASGIWRTHAMFNVLLEAIVEWAEIAEAGATTRQRAVTILPGFRTGWNAGDTQTVVGVGIPLTFANGQTDAGVFAYFSYELPFIPQP